MPKLVSFLIRHALIGFVLAGVCVTLLVNYDVAGIGTLMATSGTGVLATVCLTFLLGLTFASAQMGFGIMLLADTNSRDDDGAGRFAIRKPRAVDDRVRAHRPAASRRTCLNRAIRRKHIRWDDAGHRE